MAIEKVIKPIAQKIGKEVAEGLAPTAENAAKKVVKAVKDKANDWGWKGGKPGELTGTRYTETLNTPLEDDNRRRALLQLRPSFPESFKFDLHSQKHQAGQAMKSFAALEGAGVPREWTGKVMRAIEKKHGTTDLESIRPSDYEKLLSNGRSIAGHSPMSLAHSMSSHMRGMTNQQRDTFLSLYPEWEGSLDDLANAAKNL